MPGGIQTPLYPTRTRVWVTRPLEDSAVWVDALKGAGMDAQALPLMAIGPAPDPHAMAVAWHHLDRYTVVMFVSANAVRYFWQGQTAGVRPLQWGLARAWVTGPGTRAALHKVDVPDAQIDGPVSGVPQLDSEALWANVAMQVEGLAARAQTVLIVRGADATGRMAGRDWLAQQLIQAGVKVDQVVAYQRLQPTLSPAQLQMAAQGASDGSIWLFSNSEALGHLQQLLPGQDWSQAKAVATHPRIATHVRAAGFTHVAIAQPDRESIAASIKSMA
jgi:uroporphyrinogen-III synthase